MTRLQLSPEDQRIIDLVLDKVDEAYTILEYCKALLAKGSDDEYMDHVERFIDEALRALEF